MVNPARSEDGLRAWRKIVAKYDEPNLGFGYGPVYLGKKLAPVPVSARFSQDADSLARRLRSHR